MKYPCLIKFFLFKSLGKWRLQQKLYQQQQQIRINKRKEHKKKKLLHQQQKQKLRQKNDPDSMNDISRKSSFKEDRKSSLKQLISFGSTGNKSEDLKKDNLEEENKKAKEETNLKILIKSLTSLDKISEISGQKNKSDEIKPLNRPIIVSSSCDNLNNKMKKNKNKLFKSIPGLPSNLTKSKSEITNISTNYELNLERSPKDLLNSSIQQLDDNNNEQEKTNSNLTETIIKSNLKNLEYNNPDYCYFKI